MVSSNIAIDGPSGSGKSSTARLVAQRLGFRYLDTGAMYRGVAVACLKAGVDRGDAAAITQVCRTVRLELTTGSGPQRLLVDGVDQTARIREPEVSAWVSAVATNPDCRAELVRRQQQLIAAGRFVLEGRDTTTVVAPDAALRVLLLADPQRRMARRSAELGGALDQAALHDQTLRRDRDDSALVNFTEPAEGVVVVDSTDLSLEQVVERVLALAAAAGLTASLD
ncbi:MAG: (d)CMP kinase [Actinomycetia bacterium]|nr:(d)CMP kinase [Actinomycetes bacterium]